MKNKKNMNQAEDKIKEKVNALNQVAHLKILVLEDVAVDAELLVRCLKKHGFQFEHKTVWTKNEYIKELEGNTPDVILSDHMMPQFNSLEALEILKRKHLEIPFILVTGTISEKYVIQLLEQGIDDYVLKHNLIRLPSVIQNVLNKKYIEIEKQKIELLNTEISLANTEKEVLLKEIHHRVKNNLQVISSLLSLQSKNIKDPHSLEQFKESQNRVWAMALVHEKLYESKDLSKIDFTDYITSFIEAINRSYNVSEGRVKVHVNINIGKSYFKIDNAIPCALILNELVSNAFKYAFPNERKGNLYLNFNKENENEYLFEVTDDGIGIPENIDLKNPSTLGLQLVDILAEQINGKVTLDKENGTRFKIRLVE